MSVNGPCQPFRHLLGAYVDGQLEPATVLAIEAHLDDCEDCREQIAFRRAVKGSLKRSVQGERVNDGMRARLAAALEAVRDDERADEQAERESQAQVATTSEAPRRRVAGFSARSFGIRSAVPLTAAAALTLLWGVSAQGPLTRAAMSSAAVDASSKELLEELVHEHTSPLPPERTDPKDLREFERYVGVQVRPKVLERAPGVHLVGGRVLPMRQERAAMLQYEMGSGADAKRVSVLIYDPRRIQVGSSDLAPRTVGTAEVRVGRERGYSVAVTQHDGVGYALATDLDTEHSAQLVNYISDEP